MVKGYHEIRDPVHIFVRLDSQERQVLNSAAFQRLRHIHQLALSYLVYPGASHKRFEHSLGVMELASRVFDVVTGKNAVTDQIRDELPEVTDDDKRNYWRRVLRMAALCHDIGHLPFSHTAERELLPPGWDHERITRELILSDELKNIWSHIRPPLDPTDIVKLAVGPKKARDISFSNWETILSEIIVGDAFGVDRMDYLLRDSHHTGVAYGRFDHYRLIDTLRILPLPPLAEGAPPSGSALGVEEGGIQSAEALLLARYFMYSQVYFHPVRRIYDIHLRDFLSAWLPGGQFTSDIQEHLRLTDNEVLVAIREAAAKASAPGHESAHRIICRDHFRLLYQRHPQDVRLNPDAAISVHNAAAMQFGVENVRLDRYRQSGAALNFPVSTRDGRIASSLAISETLIRLPPLAIDYVFVAPEIRQNASSWLDQHRSEAIKPDPKENP
jgi:HD superfamily phosphohydrolase